MFRQHQPANERVTACRRIYDGRIVNLREDTVTLADGRPALREVVEHSDVVAIVPIDSDGKVLLVRQYRLPAGEILLEVLPAVSTRARAWRTRLSASCGRRQAIERRGWSA